MIVPPTPRLIFFSEGSSLHFAVSWKTGTGGANGTSSNKEGASVIFNNKRSATKINLNKFQNFQTIKRLKFIRLKNIYKKQLITWNYMPKNILKVEKIIGY